MKGVIHRFFVWLIVGFIWGYNWIWDTISYWLDGLVKDIESDLRC